MSESPKPPLPIPLPVNTPLTPEAQDERTLNVHSSPSFDYHEERRLHLKDEIWLSHHLPRLPPSSIPSTVASSPRATTEDSTANSSRATPKSVMANGDGVGESSRRLNGEMGLGIGIGRNLHNAGALMSMSSADPVGREEGEESSRSPIIPEPFTKLSPCESEDEPSCVGPEPTLIHRRELDDQERLDLEAERMEKELSDLGVGSSQSTLRERGSTEGDARAVKGAEQGEFVISFGAVLQGRCAVL